MANTKGMWTAAQEQEIVQAYEDKTLTGTELAEMHKVNVATIFQLLKRKGIVPHTKRNPKPKDERKNGPVVIRKIDKPYVELPPAEEEVLPVIHTGQVEVVVDKQNVVQSVERTLRPQETWEIKYQGTVMVQADDIEAAIREARKIGVVKKIYSVRIRGQ